MAGPRSQREVEEGCGSRCPGRDEGGDRGAGGGEAYRLVTEATIPRKLDEFKSRRDDVIAGKVLLLAGSINRLISLLLAFSLMQEKQPLPPAATKIPVSSGPRESRTGEIPAAPTPGDSREVDESLYGSFCWVDPGGSVLFSGYESQAGPEDPENGDDGELLHFGRTPWMGVDSTIPWDVGLSWPGMILRPGKRWRGREFDGGGKSPPLILKAANTTFRSNCFARHRLEGRAGAHKEGPLLQVWGRCEEEAGQ